MLARTQPLPDAIVRDGRHRKTAVDYGRLRGTPEALYSMLLPRQVDAAMRAFALELPDLPRRALAGLDATACVGGDTCNLAVAFPRTRMTAIERDDNALAALRHNVDALGLADRVAIVKGDCVEIVRGHPARGDSPYDFVYCDPPWGGPGAVKGKRAVMLDLSGAPVTQFVKRVLATGVAPLVVLKAPPNFDKKRLLDELTRAGFRPACRTHRVGRDFDLHFVRGASRALRAPDQVFAQVGRWVREKNAAGPATLERAAAYLAHRCDIEAPAAKDLLADLAEGGCADGVVLNSLRQRLATREDYEPEAAPALLVTGALHFVAGGSSKEEPAGGGGKGDGAPLPRPRVLFVGGTRPEVPTVAPDSAPDRAAVGRGRGPAPELPEGPFDAVVIDTVLYTIPDVAAFLADVKSRLAPGGSVAVREHDILESYAPFLRIVQYCEAVFGDEVSLRRRPGAAFDSYRKSVASQFHTRDDWCRIFMSAGFAIRAESQAAEVTTLHRFAVFMTAKP